MEKSEREGSHETGKPMMHRLVTLSLQRALIERGLWKQVSERLRATSPSALHAIEDANAGEWFTVKTHLELLDAVRASIGLDAIAELGRARIRGMQTGEMFPSIVGSWTRTFKEGADVVKVLPFLWRAATLNNGELVLKEITASHASFRLEGCARDMCLSEPWRVAIEGMGLGVLDRVALTGTFVATVVDEGAAVVCDVSWARS